jgi:hypothetical protein
MKINDLEINLSNLDKLADNELKLVFGGANDRRGDGGNAINTATCYTTFNSGTGGGITLSQPAKYGCP